MAVALYVLKLKVDLCSSKQNCIELFTYTENTTPKNNEMYLFRKQSDVILIPAREYYVAFDKIIAAPPHNPFRQMN